MFRLWKKSVHTANIWHLPGTFVFVFVPPEGIPLAGSLRQPLGAGCEPGGLALRTVRGDRPGGQDRLRHRLGPCHRSCEKSAEFCRTFGCTGLACHLDFLRPSALPVSPPFHPFPARPATPFFWFGTLLDALPTPKSGAYSQFSAARARGHGRLDPSGVARSLFPSPGTC